MDPYWARRSDHENGRQRLLDRRSDRRYRIPLGLCWQHGKENEALASGVGRTLDISSGGILFEADQELGVGQVVKLSISWPLMLGKVVALQLVVMGEVVRTRGSSAAVRILHHEFRTAPPRARRSHKGANSGLS